MTLSFLIKKAFTLFASIFVTFYLVFTIIYVSKVNCISNRSRIQGIKSVKNEKFSLLKVSKEYIIWLKNVKSLSFGVSSYYGVGVSSILKVKIKNTFILNCFALFILMFFGVLLGVITAIGKNSIISIIEIFFFVIYAIPDFILAIFLILIFSIKLNLFPSCGIVSVNHDDMNLISQFFDYLKHLFLPALSLSLSSIIFLGRFTKNSIVGILHHAHIVALKVRGVDTLSNKIKHVLKNSIYPFISLFTFIIPGLISGSIIIETIFGYPGIGKVLFLAVSQRDFPLLVGVSFINVVVVYTSIFLTDILYQVFRAGGGDEKFL